MVHNPYQNPAGSRNSRIDDLISFDAAKTSFVAALPNRSEIQMSHTGLGKGKGVGNGIDKGVNK